MPRPTAAFIAVTTSLTAGITTALVTSAGLAAPFSVDIEPNADATFQLQGVDDDARIARPDRFRAVDFDTNALRRALTDAPAEGQPARAADRVTLSLPLPEGGFADFTVVESPIMHPDLQAKYPEIRTYIATSTDNPGQNARLSVTPHGVRLQLRLPGGQSWYIDPIAVGNDRAHASYRRVDLTNRQPFSCQVEGDAQPFNPADTGPVGRRTDAQSDETLRTYRIAITTTNEYTNFFGGTVVGGLAGVVEAVNRITGIYETDLGARFQLVPNNDLLIFTSNDPFSSVSLSAVDNYIDSQIGSNNYDVGHLFDQGGGGFAQLGVVCTSSKGRGYTGLTPPSGDPFWVDYAAHELGHQFNGTHTFNGRNGACSSSNRTGFTAWEPGSATTIMGYAGICSSDNTASNSDPVFHGGSIAQMRAFIESTTCPVVTSSGNTAPIVDAGFDLILPTETPFILTATGEDIDGDTLTYAWEQFDLGPARRLTDPDNGQSPLFRSFDASSSPTRFFPALSKVVSNNFDLSEKLPTVARNSEFGVTVRDNALPSGDTAFDMVNIQFVTSSGPFTVSGPTTGTVAEGQVTVTWNPAGTQSGAVAEDLVRVLLSTNGGQSFDIVLADQTNNDGSETLDIPAGINAFNARVLVRGIDNPFFNVNPGPFTAIGPEGCNPADIAAPFGILDLDDIDAFIAAFSAGGPDADLALPLGILDLDDIDAFIAGFGAGCP